LLTFRDDACISTKSTLTVPTKNALTGINIRVNLGEAIIKKTNKKQENGNYHSGQGIHIRVTI